MSNDTGEATTRRRYDARSRRERAVEERRATRTQVLAAARRLFLADGYPATKMTDIAREAGVALASVYRSGESKADLVSALIADEGTIDPEGRREVPHFPQVAAEPDPIKQVELIADLISEALEKVAPLFSLLRDAAALNERAGQVLQAEMEHRAVSLRVAVSLLPQDLLRYGPAEAADTLWVLCDPHSYMVLRTDRQWSASQYRDWLRRTLRLQLLKDPPLTKEGRSL